MKLLKTLGIITAIIVFVVLGSGLYINFAKPDVGLAPALTVNKDSANIERGKYLANHVTVCIDCHSQRDWSTFSGPVVPGTEGRGGEAFDKKMGFPGNIYATNLTPAVLSSWTDGEIYRAITSGVGKDGHALFPVMGYQRFGKMSKEDVESIIAYIRTLPPVKNDVPKTSLDFPVSLLNKLSPQAPNHQARPSLTDTVLYGGYLANAAGCVDCHSKQDKGKIVAGSEFGGGMEFNQPGGIIRAPNITMHKEGIGNWTSDLFVAKFKVYADTSYRPVKLNPTELNTPMPWKMYSGMTEQDLKAIYSYLKSIKPIANKVEVRTLR
ncbi:c-type cytochrome [Pedobacter sp. UBA4863]|uniref:c-type cytochrome n=1 Tax=Pedobacter sp. UBA4863 TaxID=1947060 RepID=UPI0025D61DB7|nr:c-type cytochrome [Pedobacter sp. UBA4863]